MKEEWVIKIRNPLFDFLVKWRLDRLVKRWNQDADWIKAQIEADPKGGCYSDSCFEWTRIVWQELAMWCRLGHARDFEYMCDRREFNCIQRAYIVGMLQHLKLDTKEKKVKPFKDEVVFVACGD